MKLRKLSTAALLSVLAVSAVAGGASQASAESLTGKGEVIFEQDIEANENTKNDPEDPTKDVDPVDEEDIVIDRTGGAITIDRVAKLKFGTQKISVSPDTKTYYAEPIAVTQTDPANPSATPVSGERGPWVQWTDKRAGVNHKYSIKAEMTKQFTYKDPAGTVTNATLKGATINYRNGLLNSDQPYSTNAAENNWPATSIETFTLGVDGTSAGQKLVFDNSASTGSVGIGTWTAEFGQSSYFVLH